MNSGRMALQSFLFAKGGEMSSCQHGKKVRLGAGCGSLVLCGCCVLALRSHAQKSHCFIMSFSCRHVVLRERMDDDARESSEVALSNLDKYGNSNYWE
jgi:hypothetical protein